MINVYENGKDIFISVWDNGVGIEKKKVKCIMENIEGEADGNNAFGLWNVNKRCKLLYGEPYGIHIESVLSQYTKITLKLPVMKKEG